MSEVVNELESWFKERPAWLQDATRRLLEKTNLDEKDYGELLRICCSSNGITFEEPIPDPIAIPVGTLIQNEQPNKVELCSISDIEGINALRPKNPLCFFGGLNVIYGPNGAGKSGYTRLLKQICGAKSTGSLYPNAYTARPKNQSCKVTYKYAGDELETEWNVKQGTHDHLSNIELYDAECGSIYVTAENQLAYEPSLLRLFSQLTIISDQLANRIDSLANNLVSLKPIMPIEYAKTPGYQWYRSITAATKKDQIRANCHWSAAQEKELESLRKRLNTPDPKAEVQKLSRSKTELERLIAGFKNWESKLSKDSCNSYLDCKKDYNSKQKAASTFAENVFQNSPLKGIGEDVWLRLWEAARAYSVESAYFEVPFPVTDDSSVCVLCQQELGEHAKSRLIKFEEFVKGELETSAKNAKIRLELLDNDYKKTPSDERVASLIAASNLDENLASMCQLLREVIVSTAGELLEFDSQQEFVPALNFEVIQLLSDRVKLMQKEIVQLEEDAKKDQRDLIQVEIKKLEANKWLSQQHKAIDVEVSVLSEKAKLQAAKYTVGTTALTRKKSALAEELINADYIKRFEKELKVLGAGKIKAKLEKSRADKGRVYFRINLEGNTLKLPVEKILSEGEFRIISLAAFLADVEGRTDKSAFVFDDPISSLDQDYEECVAERLVTLGKTRQVLVFTHRLSLMALLNEECKKQEISPEFIGLSKEPWGAGEPGLPPIHTQNTKKAINSLIGKLPEGKRILQEEGNEKYSWWAKSICSHVRITLERIVEFDLLADVVQRFRRPINTQGKLRQVAKVNQKDCDYIDQIMTKYSRYEHSQPNEAPVVPPSPDELGTDLEKLKNWLEKFVARELPN